MPPVLKSIFIFQTLTPTLHIFIFFFIVITYAGRNEGNITRSSDNHSFDDVTDDIQESDIGLNAGYSMVFGSGGNNPTDELLPEAEEHIGPNHLLL